jgi:hypothetical protein
LPPNIADGHGLSNGTLACSSELNIQPAVDPAVPNRSQPSVFR